MARPGAIALMGIALASCTGEPHGGAVAVGGIVTGLEGTGLVLRCSTGGELDVAENGPFACSAAAAPGSRYSVTVERQPTSPAQTCAAAKGAGTVPPAGVTDIAVACATNAYRLGGSVSGLLGTGLVLQERGGEALFVSADGPFVFGSPIRSGATFEVTVRSQPVSPWQTCEVARGSGTVRDADVIDVAVTCRTNAFRVGGTVSGLAGGGLVLQNRGGDDLPVVANGAFAFPAVLGSGSPYEVTVRSQPVSPRQACSVVRGSGTVRDTDVTDVAVACRTQAYHIGGTMSGLLGAGLVLQNRGGDDLAITADGSFVFPAAVESGAPYDVTVRSQPTSPWQTCRVARGAGTVLASDLSDVAVTCTTNQYAIGGAVTGLVGSGLLLQNGGDLLPVEAQGNFAFPTSVASGSSFAVVVARQPTAPTQACSVTQGTGVVAGANVTNVAVACVTRYVIGGTVSGLVGSGLVLHLDVGRGEDLPIVGNGSFRFATPGADGMAYHVTVQAPPVSPAQVCVVSGGDGTIAGADTSIAVTCSISGPSITSFQPTSGTVGTVVTITGQGFMGATAVRFGGIPAVQYFVHADTQIAATVPPGAVTGTISVTAPAGTATSAGVFGVSAGLDLWVDAAHVTQATQTYVPTVPLVAGRPGLLRVFLLANQADVAAPRVDVRLVQGGATVWLRTIDPPAATVPTQVVEGNLDSSWNLPLSASDLVARADLQFVITADPGSAIPEADRSNNTLVLAAAPRSLPTWPVTLVPIALTTGVGAVTESNKASWVDRLERVYPIAAMDVRVGAPFTPSVSGVQSDGTGWADVLGDLEAKRAVEASDRYYFGAMKVAYSGGVAGMAYLGQPSALGWDRTGLSDGANYPEVLAHEVGHNFARRHAPCGNPSGVDPGWPAGAAYQDARIGVWGWDLRPSPTSPTVLKDPSTSRDIMGYCGDVWTSDYTYEGVLGFRQGSPMGIAWDLPRDCLLVSGIRRGDRLELRPAFRVEALPSAEGGSHLLEIRDGSGRVLKRFAFELVEAMDGGQDEGHFTLAVPVDDLDATLIESLTVSSAGQMLARLGRRPAAAALSEEPLAIREGPRRTRLDWDHGARPRVMVRDPLNGEVLAFGEGGSLLLLTDFRYLEVHASDGVSSDRRVLLVR